jgi:hypothetical protein
MAPKKRKTAAVTSYGGGSASGKRVDNAVGPSRAVPNRRSSCSNDRKVGIVRVATRFARKILGPTFRDECGGVSLSAWRFSKSDRGPVFICSRCKPFVLDCSFGTTDAPNYAETGGRFEGNRRKH